MVRLTIQQAFDQASQHHQAGRLREAGQLYRQILAEQPDHADALHYLGVAAAQGGQHDIAVDSIRRAIALNPNSAEAHSNLGNSALRDNRQLDEAIAAYRQAIVLKPSYAEAHYNLGVVLQDKGQLDDAIAAYRRAIALRPGYGKAHYNLGIALQNQGRFDEAITACRQAIALSPGLAEAHCNLGNALKERGQLDEAITAYRQAIALRPNYAGAHGNLGNALRDTGRPDEAIAAYRQVIALSPHDAEAYYNLGIALQEKGHLNEAIATCRTAIALNPNSAEAHSNLGNALKDTGQLDEAIAAYRQGIALKPDYALAHTNLGNALRDKGQLDEAIAAYRQAIVVQSNFAEAHRNLAQMRRFTASDPRLTDLENLAGEMASLSETERISFHFALGKAYADLDQHERAFGHLLQGNALKRRQIGYDEAAEFARFDRIREIFTPGLMRQMKGLGDLSDVPVFILGMPRSGTTLIEQMLASHPKVFGAGELAEMALLAGDFTQPVWRGQDRGPATFPEIVPLLGQEQWRRLARYVSRISSLAPAAQRITDKMPVNFPFAGFIHLALPHARIIHARRDPSDTCLSCFSHLFARGALQWSYDLRELGRYYRAYAALMDHWRRVLPEGVMLEVQYEDLVADFEPQARRIVAFCGLEWDDRCLAFHQTKRPVRTNSTVQVRQPIYRSSIGRWRPYKELLQPLLDELDVSSKQAAD